MSNVIYKVIYRSNNVLTHYERFNSKTKAKNILKDYADKFNLMRSTNDYYVCTNDCPPSISIEIEEEEKNPKPSKILTIQEYKELLENYENERAIRQSNYRFKDA
jgi:hypothetical protein